MAWRGPLGVAALDPPGAAAAALAGPGCPPCGPHSSGPACLDHGLVAVPAPPRADKMHAVAPNLSALIGELVGARLISHAGSLTNLAKYPASTVQILGAEKALFR